MELTYLGHACFQLTIGSHSLLFDPFISGNPQAQAIDIHELKTDYILLSHGHQDHVLDVQAIYEHNQAQIIANFEVATWFQNQGLDRVTPMNHGGQKVFDFGTLKMVNAVHSSSMPDGSYGGNPIGFVLQTSDYCLYYAGDTALHMDMKLIADQFSVNAAILPIGDHFTMGIEDALVAAKFVKTNKIIGMHFDTFPPIEIDHEAAKNLADSQGKELILMQIGSSIKL